MNTKTHSIEYAKKHVIIKKERKGQHEISAYEPFKYGDDSHQSLPFLTI